MSYPWCDFAAKGTFPTASYELSWMCPAMTEEGWPHDTFLSWDEIFRAGALCGFWAGLPLSHLGSRYKKRDLKQHCQQHESLTLVKWIEALGCWWCKWPFKHKPYPCYGLKQKILRLMVVNLKCLPLSCCVSWQTVWSLLQQLEPEAKESEKRHFLIWKCMFQCILWSPPYWLTFFLRKLMIPLQYKFIFECKSGFLAFEL